MRAAATRFNMSEPGLLGAAFAHRIGMAAREHAPDVKVCPSCRGKKVDRFGFDCSRCFGDGEVNE